ncbi:tetratricopeptide repeat protein [Oleiharenicola lentus]|uniref:tetratricopeptide repeat protein n=1 Tax=Oleiharenicola lentus TaxID=2508720 RepID=UPI003F6635FC
MIQIHPLNTEARRALAGFYDRASQAQALEVWNEVAQMEPKNPENWLGLAKSAIQALDQKTSQRALEKLKELGETGVEYRRLATASALLAYDSVALEEHLKELSQALPDDVRIKFTLVAQQIHSKDQVKNRAARAEMIKLVKQNPVRLRATLELISDVVRRHPRNTPEREAEFNALVLEIVPPIGPRVYEVTRMTALDLLVDYARSQPGLQSEDVAVFLRWMTANNWSANALRWLDRQDAALLDSRWVKPAAADAALEVGDWTRLRTLVADGAWGPIPIAAYDQALKLYQTSGRGKSSGVQAWSEVIEACRTSLPGLKMLGRLTKEWKWPDERQQVLQAIAKGFPRETWAWRELISYAINARDSQLLWRTYVNRSLSTPGDVGVQIEAAMVGLLTGQRNAATVEATQELLRREPKNNAVKIIHALALWRAKRFAEAAPILDELPKAVFAEPRYAFVYGLVLAETSRLPESLRMLEWAAAERLLPEESLLLEETRARVEARLRSAPRTQ